MFVFATDIVSVEGAYVVQGLVEHGAHEIRVVTLSCWYPHAIIVALTVQIVRIEGHSGVAHLFDSHIYVQFYLWCFRISCGELFEGREYLRLFCLQNTNDRVFLLVDSSL